MLAFTPDVQHVVHVFGLTHQQVIDSGITYWRRTALWGWGGAGDQDAWLTQALEHLRSVHEELLVESLERAKRERALQKWRQERDEERKRQTA